MFKQFYPHAYVDSVFSIDYTKLYQKGYRGILFDIDNTLVHHGEDSTEEIDSLFQAIHSTGLKTLLLTNNSEERVKRFVKNIDTAYLCEAQKPKVSNYFKALEILNIKKESALCIGDQLFTDVFGSNRCGIDSILVRYLRYEDETKIGIRRNAEKLVLKFYTRNRACQNRIVGIAKEHGVLRHT